MSQQAIEKVEQEIRSYIEDQVLHQQSTGLQVDSPLLSTGILTSLSLVRLVAFAEERFGVEVPMYEVTGQRFATVASIAGLVVELQATGARDDLAAGRPA